jgi:hypothetical protein
LATHKSEADDGSEERQPRLLIHTGNATERNYRDKDGWVKESTRARTLRATAEQVLNHVLPTLAGLKPNVTIEVELRETVA